MEENNQVPVRPLGSQAISALLCAGAVMGVGIFLTQFLLTNSSSAGYSIFFLLTGIHPKGLVLSIPVIFFVVLFVLCRIGLFITKKAFSRNIKIPLLLLTTLYPIYFLVYAPYQSKQAKIANEER